MVLDFCPFGCLLSSFSAAFCRFPSFCLPFRLLFVDFRPFGCLLSSLRLPCWARCSFCSPLNIGFEIYGFGFLSFWLPFVFLFGCFLSISVLSAALCLLFGCLVGPAAPSAVPSILVLKFMVLEFCPFGCLLSSFSAAFCRSVLVAAFCIPFRLLFVEFRPFGCLLSFLWLPCWARCSFRSPLNIGFEIYGFGFLSFWLPFVFLFGCLLSISVLLAAFCLLFGCLVGPTALSAVP